VKTGFENPNGFVNGVDYIFGLHTTDVGDAVINGIVVTSELARRSGCSTFVESLPEVTDEEKDRFWTKAKEALSANL
jgi:hypothetical protein